MRKRLRKKKHLGEFRQFGFSVHCRLQPETAPGDFDRFIDAFIADAIEAGGLAFGGGGSPGKTWRGVVSREDNRASTTEADQAALANWLRRHPLVESFQISAPFDLWHGSDPLADTAT